MRTPGYREATAANIQLVVPYSKWAQKMKISLLRFKKGQSIVQEQFVGFLLQKIYLTAVFIWDSAGSDCCLG